ncbi:S-DNA-T family DNA segregation ATPase FtsK/SpoIIIE [Leifsonia sp. AK011]|uniref:FtsK/SpoIIIE domain-containing protein n=1 Tax=Leifsonia sp. AK011 TaxID=2723075 RepID=UPI0015CB18C2|nr:FtsK/SpoIIIE domain-containing protein [Leifsonia sp. AK011]NYF11326.1 S-DNA-T family DNA segregation ATPase FtsK/SpoIIIE [Leifsonia sp. AK011]
MKLKLTLQRPSGPDTDVVITTDAAATVGEVASVLSTIGSQSSPQPATAATLRIVDPVGSAHAVLEPEVALGEAAVGSGATVAVVPPGSTAPAKLDNVAVLTVIEGPDTGASFALPLGTRYLGRDASLSDVTLTDPLVSKRHARLDVFSQAVRFVDLNSANGLEVDGGLVTRVDLDNGATVRVGDTVLRADIAPTEAPSVLVNDGPVAFNRSPRVDARYPGEKFVAPLLPSEEDKAPFPWLVLAAPLILGPVMFMVTGQLTSLIFIAMSPLLVAGNFLAQRATKKRKKKLDGEKFDTRFDDLSETLARERDRERTVRQAETPSTREVYDDAMRLGPLLWTRRPEHWQFLSLNLGRGILPSRNSVTISGEESALPEYLVRLRELVESYEEIDEVPVVENLYFAGALGVVGRQDVAADLARGLIVQATGLHSPAELVIASIVSPAWTPEFEWLKWLPHTGSVQSPITGTHLANSSATGAALLSALEEIVASRTARAKSEKRGAASLKTSAIVAGASAGEKGAATEPPPTPTPAILVIISDDAPVDKARLVQMAEAAADVGIFPLWVSSKVENLPAVARTFVTTEGPESTEVGFVRLGSQRVSVVADHVTRAEALAFGRRLAPVFDAGAVLVDSSDLPRTVSMLSLVGSDLADDPQVAVERWTQNDSIHVRSGIPAPRRAGRLRAIVGQSGVDAMHLDLRSQGPHALVGGTTGAGKSEFLQAWVLGMAAESSPDRVTFLFVDYKGGSAFADCVNLPHCVGLVTDLSPHLVRRALTSLKAELRYREHLFNRKKVKDLIEFEKTGDPEAPPALVLVIDEFAALAKEVPEFVDGVVDIAQRGRSLGIHLIMATQRPAGVIKDNLRANTNLRIALRMADESDSMDVVGDKVAAGFDPGIPGRAIAKTGPGRLTSFQSAYAGGWTTDEPVAPSIEVAALRFGVEIAFESSEGTKTDAPTDQGPTDQTRLVKTLIAAANAAKIPLPRRPWLDELASAFDVTKLRQRTDTELVLGVSDIPEEQRQDVVVFRPDTDGHLAVYGTGGSGKTVTMRTLASVAGITPRGGPVNVYALDFAGNGLRMLESLPHVGAVIPADDTERVIRLLRTLRDELSSRSERYAAVNASTITEYRALAGKPEEPRILLLVDGFPAFRTDFEATSATSPWYAVFLDLLTEGRQVGIHVAITADRPGSISTSVSSAIQKRVVLRMADDTSYAILDAPKDVLDSTSPPGRAVIDGLETQIAIVGGSPNTVDQSTATAALGEAIARTGRAPAPAVGSLPKEFAASSLPASFGGKPVLGISDLDLGPVSFDPVGVFLLGGPPASGRSNALRWMVESAGRAGSTEAYYLGNPRSELGAAAGWTTVARTLDEVNELARTLSARVADAADEPRIVIVVEGIGDFLSSAADSALVELIKAVKRSNHFLIAEAETAAWNSSWPLLAEVKAARTGLLLQPETMEGDMVLRTAFPRVSRSDFPPGRGFFVARGKALRVQLPLAEG